MKIMCIANTGRELPSRLWDPNPRMNMNENTTFRLTIGQTYVVYGFTLVEKDIWYYICDDGFVYFPIWHPAPLFQVVDHRMSRFWAFDYSPGERCETMSGVIVAYPEWVKDPFYYDRLSDGSEPELQTFIKYKKLIDDEYDQPTE